MQNASKRGHRGPLDGVVNDYYTYPATNPSEVVLQAAIPDGSAHPDIEVNGTFYEKGVRLHFDDSWGGSSVPVLITINNAPGWFIGGWEPVGPNTWKTDIPSNVIQSMLDPLWPFRVELSFTFFDVHQVLRHDPGIVVTRPT